MLTIWSKERATDLLYTVGNPQVEVNSGDTPPNPKGRVLLCLGKKPLEYFTVLGLVPKNRTITSLRGNVYTANLWGQDVSVMFSYSTGIGAIDSGKFLDLQTDLNMSLRLERTGTLAPILGDYRYVGDFKEAIAELKQREADGESRIDIALDLETLTLDPYKMETVDKGKTVPRAYIITVQFTYREGMADVVYFDNKEHADAWIKDNYEDMKWILNHPNLVMNGANLKYDLHWIYRHFNMECSNFKFDTTLVGSLLDENRSNALDVHAKIYCPELGGYSDVFDKTVDKGRMDLVPKDKLLSYAGGDTDATYRVKQAQKRELLKQPRLASFYVNILHPSARAFEKIEIGGVHIDRGRWEALQQEVGDKILDLAGKAKKIIGGRLVAKHGDSSRPEGINIQKASLLNDFMFSPMGLNLKPLQFTEKTGAPSSAMEHLQMFADHPEAKEFIGLLEEYGSATKTMSTYIVGFAKHIRSDGRFHPSYYFFAGNRDTGEGGTVTGRLSVRDPAFQTIPKHTYWGKKLRSCYTAPDGHLVGEFDYSQGELRVVACVANEHNMIEAYQNGKDLHTLTASDLIGVSYDEMIGKKKTDKEWFDTKRQYGKPCNFGLLYGMSAQGLVDYARANYGVHFTLAQAQEFREVFLYKSYPMLPVYHDNYKRMAREYGYVESPLGRIRHLPLIRSRFNDIRSGAERQAVNSPIQGCLSDMLCWSTAICDQRGLNKISPDFGAIHDATYKYIPIDRVDEVVEQQLEIMENLPFHKVGWNPQLKFIADAKVGTSMGQLDEWEAGKVWA